MKFNLLLSLSWLILLLGFSCKSPQQGIIDKCNQYEIIISKNPTRSVKLAAKELQSYFTKLIDCQPEIHNTSNSEYATKIYVGQSRFTDNLGIDPSSFNHGAFKIVSGKKWLVLIGKDDDFVKQGPYSENHRDIPRMMKEWDQLTGGRWNNPVSTLFKSYNKSLDLWEYDERGSLNAVYEFLRMQGVRWYLPGEFGEYLPSVRKITIPQVDKLFEPDFKVRDLYFSKRFIGFSDDEMLWYLRMGLYKSKEFMGIGEPGHGMALIQNRPEIKRSKKEFFGIYNGKRDVDTYGHGYPCLSSKGLLRENIELAKAAFDIYNMDVISVMPVDGYHVICGCNLCRPKNRSDFGFKGNLSNYVWEYVNKVAKELYITHPEKKISCFAYGPYLLPPDNIDKLSPNVVVGICQWRREFEDPKVKALFEEIRKGWSNLIPSGQILIWDYYITKRYRNDFNGIPIVFPHRIADDLKSLRGKSLGEFIEVFQVPGKIIDFSKDFATNHINLYITSRLYWNVDQNVDNLLDEYYTNFYGPAAKVMENFFKFSEENWPRMIENDMVLLEEAKQLLLMAKKKAKKEIHQQRIEMIQKHLVLYKSSK